MRQLEELARKTHTPLGYFFLALPPVEELPIPFFRTGTGDVLQTFSANLLETVQTMELRQAWMRDDLIKQGQEPLWFVKSAQLSTPVEVIARSIRDTLAIEGGWAAEIPTWTGALREMERRAESAGILVSVNGIVGNNTHRKLDPLEFRGFVLVDEFAPLVFVNGTDFKAAQMFTLAHEFAHIWLGASAGFDLANLQPAPEKIEQVCNQVAAEFLVPANELQQTWSRAREHNAPFDYLARIFKVSSLVAARRALDLGLIATQEFFEFYAETRVESITKKPSSGGNFYATQDLRIGRRFASAVVRATREGELSYTEAYRLMGLHGSAFERYAKKLGER